MRILFAFVIAGLAACGGPAEGPKSPTGAGSGSGKPAAAGDVSFEVPVIEVKGLLFEPEALGHPGMPLVEAKRKTTLDKQRAVFASTKDPVQKEAQAAVLATMLYQKSKDAPEAEKQQLVTEARQALRDAAAVSKDKVDEVTLRLLGSYELILDDYAAAEAAWSQLVTKAPKDKEEPYNRAWWAYSLLKEFKNAEALAAVKDAALSEKQPELAYVIAWAKWRANDEAGAWQAIVTAIKGWANMPGREAIDRDVLLFAGRTGATQTDAIGQLSPIYGKAKDQQYELLAKLGLQSYQFAGRWADGVSALDKAVDIAGDKVPPNDRPILRYQQADYLVRLDDPGTAAKYAKQAIEALPACGVKCSNQDKENIVESVYILGRMFHILYATAHDDRYFEPAKDLYQLSIPLITMNQATHDQAMKDQDVLERTFKAMKHDAGTHDKQALGALLNRHNQEIQACYEQWLSANPKLGGTVVLNLEADQNGVIKGASTEPKAGLADMSAVAGCIAEHARGWKLPKKANGTAPAGSTRIKLSYSLSARKDAKDAKPAK